MFILIVCTRPIPLVFELEYYVSTQEDSNQQYLLMVTSSEQATVDAITQLRELPISTTTPR